MTRGVMPAPTESAACRAEHHGICRMVGCPCLCHEPHRGSTSNDIEADHG